MKLILSEKKPDKPGFYWFLDYSEYPFRGPTVLEVTEEEDGFYAANHKFDFLIPNSEFPALWGYIPYPFLPSGEQIERIL